MSDASKPIVAVTSGGPHAWITINALRAAYGPFPVILEKGESASVFWRRRLKRLGPVQVLGQWGAMAVAKLTKRRAQARIDQLIADEKLEYEPHPDQELIQVESVNAEATRAALERLAPEVVYVVSTRMIRKATLNCVSAPFINYHSGINPAYRGIHGGYFALARGEPEHFGSTVHLVDDGVDTGKILLQARFKTTRDDNLHTYMWLMAAKSRAIVVRAIGDALTGRLRPVRVAMPSRQYFGPTLWFYLWTGFRRGVW